MLQMTPFIVLKTNLTQDLFTYAVYSLKLDCFYYCLLPPVRERLIFNIKY